MSIEEGYLISALQRSAMDSRVGLLTCETIDLRTDHRTGWKSVSTIGL